MTPTFIKATTIPDAWFSVLYHLYDKYDAYRRADEAHSEPLKKGHLNRAAGVRRYRPDSSSDAATDRIEFDFCTVQITNPGARPLLPQMPEGSGLPEIADNKYVEDYVRYLLTDGREENEHYTYGERLMKQFHRAIDIYKRGHQTNQVCMEIGTPDDLSFYDRCNGTSPCLRLIDTRIQDGKLHWIVYFRSWNLWNGFPVNLAGLQQVKELMAYEIGVDDGEIIAISKGLAIRDYCLDLVKARLKR